jgi:3'-5' exoribonuclease
MQTIVQIREAYDAAGGAEFIAEGRFVVASYSTREGKNGTYANVDLRDPSGNLPSRCFDAASYEDLQHVGAVDARLRISTFNGAISVVIQSFRKAELTQDEIMRFAGLDPELHAERVEKVRGYLADCEGTMYGDVLREAFGGGAWELFIQAPAAVKMHHAEPGGLVRHIVEVAEAGLGMLDSTGMPYDRAYFLAGVLLHDLGKIDTYTLPPTIQYTAQGRMGEHQIWSTFRLGKACAAVGAPKSIESRLLHIIEQAHGAFRHAAWQDPLGVEVKALAAADFFSSRLGTTDKEQQAQDALDRLLTADASDQMDSNPLAPEGEAPSLFE